MPSLATTTAPSWGLWSHHSWRVLAAHGTIFFTTVFFAFCAKNLGQDIKPIIGGSSEVVQGSATIARGAASFIAGYTIFSYSNFQKDNQLRTNNLSILVNIGALADTLLKKYSFETTQYPQLDKLSAIIKQSARECVSMRTKGLELTEQLEEVNQFMEELHLHLSTFISTLPDFLDQLKPETLEQEIRFWQKDPLEIKEELLSPITYKALEV